MDDQHQLSPLNKPSLSILPADETQQEVLPPDPPEEKLEPYEKKPTRKQQKFIELVLRGYTRRQAALKAGYSLAYVDQHMSELINAPSMKKELARRWNELFTERLQTREIVNAFRLQAQANIRDFVEVDPDNPNKVYFDLRHLSREQFAQIRNIQYDAEGRLRVQLHDSQRALEALARITALDPTSSISGETPLTIAALDEVIKNELARRNNTKVTINAQINNYNGNASK